jgi:hypothetical protein
VWKVSNGYIRYNSTVEALPNEIELNFPDPILIGKKFLGPGYVEENFGDKSNIWSRAVADFVNYKNWCIKRQKHRRDIPSHLDELITEVICADYQDLTFHQKVSDVATQLEPVFQVD